MKSQDGLESRKIPKETLDSITTYGNISISTACYRECITMGIPVNYFSTNGTYFGKLSSTRHTKANRVKKQVYVVDDKEMSMVLAKKIIHAKISNQLVLLRRYQRSTGKCIKDKIKRIEHTRNKIEKCSEISELMGYEGNAAREYFSALSILVNDGFKFSGRNKQPPKDPFNSMLSLGYTILLYEIYNEIENRGLTPYIGFMHSPHDAHPALASDLLEEWRAVIVDSTVMNLIQGNEIKVSDFYYDSETQGVYLTKQGKKIFINKLEKKLQTEVGYLCSNEIAKSFRRGIYLQSVAFTRAVEKGKMEEYVPLYIR